MKEESPPWSIYEQPSPATPPPTLVPHLLRTKATQLRHSPYSNELRDLKHTLVLFVGPETPGMLLGHKAFLEPGGY